MHADANTRAMPAFRHEMPVQLRFSDIDRYGHVNNAVYFSLFDMAKSQYLVSVIGQRRFSEFAMVVANVNADFMKSVMQWEQITLQTSVIHIGNKSFTLLQRAVNKQTHEQKCECRTVMVCFNTTTQQSEPMPDDIRRKIIAYEGRDLG